MLFFWFNQFSSLNLFFNVDFVERDSGILIFIDFTCGDYYVYVSCLYSF